VSATTQATHARSRLVIQPALSPTPVPTPAPVLTPARQLSFVSSPAQPSSTQEDAGRLTPEPYDDASDKRLFEASEGKESALNGKHAPSHVSTRHEGSTPLHAPVVRRVRFDFEAKGAESTERVERTPSPASMSEDDADSSSPKPGPRVVALCPPKLSKAGYYTTPSLKELEGYSLNELSRVEGFSVTRSGIGSIRWTGPVDLIGADLDAHVLLEQGYVSVYEDLEVDGEGEDKDGVKVHQQGGEPLSKPLAKPSRGEKLNCPAVVTLHGIFPKPGASAQRVRDFPSKVESKTNALPGASFLSYDPSTGDWVFRVTEGW